MQRCKNNAFRSMDTSNLHQIRLECCCMGQCFRKTLSPSSLHSSLHSSLRTTRAYEVIDHSIIMMYRGSSYSRSRYGEYVSAKKASVIRHIPFGKRKKMEVHPAHLEKYGGLKLTASRNSFDKKIGSSIHPTVLRVVEIMETHPVPEPHIPSPSHLPKQRSSFLESAWSIFKRRISHTHNDTPTTA